MIGPTEQPLAIALRIAKTAEQTKLRSQQDDFLKSVFNATQIKLVDKWITANDSTLSRPEAIRRLIELGEAFRAQRCISRSPGMPPAAGSKSMTKSCPTF